MPMRVDAAARATPVAQRWSTVLQPAAGPIRVIGSYVSGCIQGAIPLPLEGEGFQTVRRGRHRYFGHPRLIQYIETIGQFVAEHGFGVLNIGDIGQARGGPTPRGHRSHQTGLDVDVWFWLVPATDRLTPEEREMLPAPSMLTADRQALDMRRWSSQHAELLQATAAFDTVERIFVHPRIKQALCNAFPGTPWLRKIRPWWGHDDHFHVRLRCPLGQTDCQSQPPLPSGDGCDASLAWWFSEAARRPPRPAHPAPRVVQLPAACQDVLEKQ